MPLSFLLWPMQRIVSVSHWHRACVAHDGLEWKRSAEHHGTVQVSSSHSSWYIYIYNTHIYIYIYKPKDACWKESSCWRLDLWLVESRHTATWTLGISEFPLPPPQKLKWAGPNLQCDPEVYHFDVEPLEDRLVLFSSEWLEHEAREHLKRLCFGSCSHLDCQMNLFAGMDSKFHARCHFGLYDQSKPDRVAPQRCAWELES